MLHLSQFNRYPGFVKTGSVQMSPKIGELIVLCGREGGGGREGYHHWVLSLWRKIVPPLCHFVDTAPCSTFHYITAQHHIPLLAKLSIAHTAAQIQSIFRCNAMPPDLNCNAVTIAIDYTTVHSSLQWQLQCNQTYCTAALTELFTTVHFRLLDWNATTLYFVGSPIFPPSLCQRQIIAVMLISLAWHCFHTKKGYIAPSHTVTHCIVITLHSSTFHSLTTPCTL